MNKEVLETQWVQAKEFLRDKWSRLTEDDLRQINGRFDLLSDKLQQRYGYTSAQAEEEIRKWNFERSGNSAYNTSTDKSYMRQTDRPIKKEENSSALKWLLALALPLLLLALYLGTSRSDELSTTAYPNGSTAPNSSYEELAVFTETPADRPIGQAIRDAIAANGSQFRDFRTLNISSSNGVVTISGSVANAQEQDRIVNILNNINGVKRINNQLEIRP